MGEVTAAARRIRDVDCLAWWWADLVRAAPEAVVDPDRFAGWCAAAVDVLACVPDWPQRLSWAVGLVCALPPEAGADPRVLLQALLDRAATVRAGCAAGPGPG